MLTAIMIGLSTCLSVLWSIVFVLPQYFGFKLYHINGNMLAAFLPHIRLSSYATNDEPNGWVVGWTEGFYLGYLAVDQGHGHQSTVKNLYIFTRSAFYTTHISKNAPTAQQKLDTPQVTLYTREGSYFNIEYRPTKYTPPAKLSQPHPSQAHLIEEIIETYTRLNYCRILLCARPGFGKSVIGIQLAAEFLRLYGGVAYVKTWGPTEPNDSFVKMYNKIKPSAKAPLVVLLDEMDDTVTAFLTGKVQISDACPMPIEMRSKRGFNDFFDAFDTEIYKHVVVLMTSNRPVAYFHELDPSLVRPGRLDIVRDG